MSWIKNLIGKMIFSQITKEATKKMPNIIGKLDGYKTYITAIIGIFVAFIGAAWGPINIGPVDIPSIPWNEFWNILWNALMIVFLRKGVTVTK